MASAPIARGFATSAVLFAPNSGRVVSWMAGRGFGFVEDSATKKQHFVHYRSLKVEEGGFRSLAVGQEIEYDVIEADGRTRAENVTAPNGVPLPSGERPPENAGGGGRGGRGGGGFRGGRGGGGGYRGGRGGGGGNRNYDNNNGRRNGNDDF